MKVFISWSGERSRQVAELLNDWIKCVIQAVTPWMSSKNIDRGALWFTEINDALANTSIGIVCLTKDNKNKPWILFESGALAKGLSSNRVCTFLIDLKPTDLENPLAQFNHTFPTKDGLFQLVTTINLSLKSEILDERILDKVFETYWPQFEAKFKTIISEVPSFETEEKRDGNDILIEVLGAVRSMEKRIRSIEMSKNQKSVMLENDNLSENLKKLIYSYNSNTLASSLFPDSELSKKIQELKILQKYKESRDDENDENAVPA